MPTDILFPNRNEAALIASAKQCGYTDIILAYHSIENVLKDRLGWPTYPGTTIIPALFISSCKRNELLKNINAAHQKKLLSFVQAQEPELNRFILEKTSATGIVNLEYIHPNDHLHFRKSGLDQVLCNIAQKQKKVIITTLQALKASENRPKILGRIMQNISFCQKYHVQYILVSGARDSYEIKGAHDIKSLVSVLAGPGKRHS